MSENTTLYDAIDEARQITQQEIEKQENKGKKIFENFATIISLSIVGLTLILYSYYRGYGEVYNIPPSVFPLKLEMFMPIAIQVLGLMIYIVYYIASRKTDNVLKRNRINPLRILYGTLIVSTLLNSNNINYLWGGIACLIIAIALPLAIEIILFFANKPKKNKEITDSEKRFKVEELIYSRFVYTYHSKFGLAFLIIMLILAPHVGRIKAKANLEYQTVIQNDTHYVIIIDYDDKVLVQNANEGKNILTIYTDSYSYLNKENLNITYKKYDKVIIDKEQNDG